MEYITTKYGCRIPPINQDNGIDSIMETIANNTYLGISNITENALLFLDYQEEYLNSSWWNENSLYNEFLSIRYSAPRQCGSTTATLACAYHYIQRGYKVYYIVNNLNLARSLRKIYPEVYDNMVVMQGNYCKYDIFDKSRGDENYDTIVFHDNFSWIEKTWNANVRDQYYQNILDKMNRVRQHGKKFIHVKIQ